MSAVTASTRTFGLNYVELAIRIAIGVACLPLGIVMVRAFWPQTFHIDLETLTRLSPLLAVGGGAYFLVTSLYTLLNAPRITITDSKLDYQSRWHNQSWNWDELTAVDGGLTKLVSNTPFAPLWTEGEYRLYSGDTVALKINNTTARVHDLYQAAAQYITNTHRERCYQRLRQGETLEFRGMKLSQSQIEIGKEALSINQVAAVNIRGLTFTIHSTAQKHAWAIYQLKDVYNPWLFQDLVQRLSREQGNQP